MVTAGDVTLNLKTANTEGYTDYNYTIKYGDDVVKEGEFDAGGQGSSYWFRKR